MSDGLELRWPGTRGAGERGASDAVAAWRWSVPVPVEDDGDAVVVGEVVPPRRRRGDAVQLVLPQEPHDAAGGPAGQVLPEAAVVERARLRVRLRGRARDGLAIAHARPNALPQALQARWPARSSVCSDAQQGQGKLSPRP